MEAFFKDLKHSLRMFAQSPAFTLAAVAALTLGIGANTAIFSVVNAVLLKPVALPDSDRVVVFINTSPRGPGGPAASPAKFAHYRQQTDIVEDVSELCSRMAIIDRGRILLEAEPEYAVTALAGRIWRRVIERAELPELERTRAVISTKLQAGKTVVRVFGDASPGAGFEPAEPDSMRRPPRTRFVCSSHAR